MAIARMVNEVRASRKIRASLSAESSLDTIPQPTGAEQPPVEPWYLNFEHLFQDVPEPPPPPTEFVPAALASISLDSGRIDFSGGVPVSGWSHLSLYPNGWYNFAGHFHDAGAPSYNIVFTWGVWSPGHGLIILAHQGHMAGTFEPGSRDHDWSIQNPRPDIAAEWANLSRGYSWRWTAHVQWDVGAAVDSMKRAVQAVAQIAQVIAIIV
jgi:hypothetical protein